MQRNRLADETSPYLQQHAANPVDWYPWGEEALRTAQKADKPILLSIGYSACHWCHVMAHESFEDPGIAELMNRLFVNIKVDREERPDLDKIYQASQQLIIQGTGGWPLTMFLTPEQTPFFGGTYFPKEARFGLPAFGDLLRRVAEYYRGHRAEIGSQMGELKKALASVEPTPGAPDTVIDETPLEAAREALGRVFDKEHGGFSRAPKFPHASSIERCLRHWVASSTGAAPDLKALFMATLSLTRMAEGGIYDQLGGGFARYSVDDQWTIPHFEKMLYDNGSLLAEYARAHLATGEPLFARVAAETADWVLRDMRSPDGAFYSSLDADSEGREGKFYVWTRAEVQQLLDERGYAAFAKRFGLDGEPNFDGRWHLRVAGAVDEDAHLVDPARGRLLAARNLRVWPGRDEKILTSWNALMIKGLAIAARVLNRDDYAAAATQAADFIRARLWRDGGLLATYKDGRAHLQGYLDDHAFLADALLELVQTRWRGADLDFARELCDALLARFEDSSSAGATGGGGRGGFFFTASDHERLIHRSKTFSDESTPSGNGVAASVLCRLGFLLGESRYLEAAERTLRAGWPIVNEYPMAHMSMINALEDYTAPLEIVIVRAPAEEAQSWACELGRLYAPTRMIVSIPNEAEDIPAGLSSKKPSGSGIPIAYLCSGMTCAEPMVDLAQLARNLTKQAPTELAPA